MSRDKIARTAGIKKQLYRNDPSHRDRADVTFGDIVKIFGFRIAKVGAWVNKVRLLGLKKILEYYILSTVKFSKISQTHVIMFVMFPHCLPRLKFYFEHAPLIIVHIPS